MVNLNPEPRTGRIVAHYGLRVRIDTGGAVVEFKPPRRESWVVGDVIVFDKDRPKTIQPRVTELARIGPLGKRQVLAANLDALFIVTACDGNYKPGLIDRFIVAARHGGMSPSLVINKTDIDPDGSFRIAAEKYREALPLYFTSATLDEGILELAMALRDVTASLVGQSGVGKTSLANCLVPGLDRAVAAINEKTGQGRHTTAASLMLDLPSGGRIIDSPGVRQFIPSQITLQEAARYFPGFEVLEEENCKFSDCLHVTEPGCVVKALVEDGTVGQERYASYLRLLESVKGTIRPEWE